MRDSGRSRAGSSPSVFFIPRQCSPRSYCNVCHELRAFVVAVGGPRLLSIAADVCFLDAGPHAKFAITPEPHFGFFSFFFAVLVSYISLDESRKTRVTAFFAWRRWPQQSHRFSGAGEQTAFTVES